MLKVNNYGNLKFRGYVAPEVTSKSPVTLPLGTGSYQSERDEDDNYERAALREGVFRYKVLSNTRPVMLSHTAVDYNQWLSQFDTAEERNLALKILQNFTYIDLANARKAYRKLHKELEGEIDLNKTKFASLGTSKSGSMMTYLYRQANKMRSKGTVQHEFTDKANMPKEEQFLNSTQLQDKNFNDKLRERGFENIVIIDDMIGDGDSLIEYFTPELVESLKDYKNIYYLTLIKDPDGEQKVLNKFPNLNIKFKCAQEVLKYDSPKNNKFTPEEKERIDELVLKYGNRIAPDLVEKYDRSKLFVAFDWNTPGNTPMMFNYSTNNWQALFERYNGLERGDVGVRYEFCG